MIKEHRGVARVPVVPGCDHEAIRAGREKQYIIPGKETPVVLTVEHIARTPYERDGYQCSFLRNRFSLVQHIMRVQHTGSSHEAIGEKSQKDGIPECRFQPGSRLIEKSAYQHQHDTDTIQIEPGEQCSEKYGDQGKEE